jgi:hypothetical protein
MVTAVTSERPPMSEATSAQERAASQAPVTTLRGADVGPVDARRVGQVVIGLCLALVASLAVALFLSGLHKNVQISSLHQHGVIVQVRVTKCVGLIGGSGSNTTGNSCRGTLVVGGHRYNEAIPGTAFLSVGQTIRVVTVPGDPALLAPVHTVARERTSWSVYIVPAILVLALLLLIALLLFRRRRQRHATVP